LLVNLGEVRLHARHHIRYRAVEVVDGILECHGHLFGHAADKPDRLHGRRVATAALVLLEVGVPRVEKVPFL